MRLAFTADLHWGVHRDGDAATRLLADSLRADPPDVLVLAGDVGTEDHFSACLALFDPLPSLKALVPGNHDIWVRPGDPRGDSLHLYRVHLPSLAEAHGFHYLDRGPLFLPRADLALVGTINWYDHSWAPASLRRSAEGQERLQSKRFTRGRHNDARFVQWPMDDAGFTRAVVATLAEHLAAALRQVSRVIVVTHHPPFYGLSFPRHSPLRAGRSPPAEAAFWTGMDLSLWDAFAGNQALEDVLRRHAGQVAFAFCGHTHWARDNTLAGIRGYNIGGDYHGKRLLLLDWPAGDVSAHLFLEGAS